MRLYLGFRTRFRRFAIPLELDALLDPFMPFLVPTRVGELRGGLLRIRSGFSARANSRGREPGPAICHLSDFSMPLFLTRSPRASAVGLCTENQGLLLHTRDHER